jgi:hypothetical protein
LRNETTYIGGWTKLGENSKRSHLFLNSVADNEAFGENHRWSL